MRNFRPLYILPFLLLFLLSACAPAEQSPGGGSRSSAGASSTAAVSLPEGSFQPNADGNMYGTVYARGYATVQTVSEPFCDKDCKEYDYVFFRVQDTGNESFREFLTAQQGNSFVGTDPLMVGLGCVSDGVISYENHSDAHGRKTFTLDRPLSASILGSTSVAPVTLSLSKETLSGGSGAPACYSHMTEIALWSGGPSSGAAASSAPGKSVAKDGCAIGGCSAHLCGEEGDNLVSTCEYREAYGCYQGQTCERQATGKCGWTVTEELRSCLQNAR